MNTFEPSLEASLMPNSVATGLPDTSAIGSELASDLARTQGAAQMLSPTSEFVKGINFNGDAVTIDGNRWLSQNQAINEGLIISILQAVPT